MRVLFAASDGPSGTAPQQEDGYGPLNAFNQKTWVPNDVVLVK